MTVWVNVWKEDGNVRKRLNSIYRPGGFLSASQQCSVNNGNGIMSSKTLYDFISSFNDRRKKQQTNKKRKLDTNEVGSNRSVNVWLSHRQSYNCPYEFCQKLPSTTDNYTRHRPNIKHDTAFVYNIDRPDHGSDTDSELETFFSFISLLQQMSNAFAVT